MRAEIFPAVYVGLAVIGRRPLQLTECRIRQGRHETMYIIEKTFTVSAAHKLRLIEKRLDHHVLNQELPGMNPTAENIAKWITEVVPYCVRAAVQETEGNVAIYDSRI